MTAIFCRIAIAVLLLVPHAASAGRWAPRRVAQKGKPTFQSIRRRVEAELSKTATKRLAGIRLLRPFRTPQARKFLFGLWNTEKNPAIRRTVLGLLALHEHRTTLVLMRGQLNKSQDAKLQRIAARGLLVQEAAGMTALVDATRAARKTTRTAAIQALASVARARPAAAQALRAATMHLEGAERYQALVALRSCPKPPSFLAHLEVLTHEKFAATRGEALRQLALAKAKSARELTLTTARDAKSMKQPAVQRAVIFALAALADAQTLPALLELGISSPAAVTAELGVLRRQPTIRDHLVGKLAAIRKSSDKPIDRLVAVEMLGRFKTKAASRALIGALSDPSTAVVLAALLPVARNHNREALPQLRRLFHGKNPELQVEAMAAMHTLLRRDARWPSQLMAQLDSPSIAIRCLAIDKLAELRYAKALPRIRALAAAPAWQVRSAAYGYLRRVPAKSSIGVLVHNLQTESGRLGAECLGALVELTQRNYPRPKYWKRWWAAAERDFRMPRPIAAGTRKKQGKKPGEPIARLSAALTYYDIPLTSKRTCFLLDTSGSMQALAGTAKTPRLRAAKEALAQVVKASAPDLYFNLIPFSTGARPWSTKLQTMTAANKAEATAYARSLHAGGGTNIYAALRAAFDDPLVDTIYLLTDGDPSVGKITNPAELAATVARWNRERRIIIHTISFGKDSALLRRLAKDSGGRYVRFI